MLLSGRKTKFLFGYFKVYRIGLLRSIVTPVGLMGGEPYRIMELTPYLGVERATSSVILYVMMHIFSHFVFGWLLCFYLFLFPVNMFMAIVLGFRFLFFIFVSIMVLLKDTGIGMAVAFCAFVQSHSVSEKYAARKIAMPINTKINLKRLTNRLLIAQPAKKFV